MQYNPIQKRFFDELLGQITRQTFGDTFIEQARQRRRLSLAAGDFTRATARQLSHNQVAPLHVPSHAPEGNAAAASTPLISFD